MRYKLIVLLALIVGLLGAHSGVASAAPVGNDYPWPGTWAASANDPWGMMKGHCTSFVAWRSHQNGRPIVQRTAAERWAGKDWDERARERGWRVDQRPTVGSFAQWDAGETTHYVHNGERRTFRAGTTYGHVGYVAAVYSDGTLLLEDYNRMGTSRYASMRIDRDYVGDFIHYGA